MRHLCAFSSYRVNTGYYRIIVAVLRGAAVYAEKSLQLHAAWLKATHALVFRFPTHNTARLTAPTISRTLKVLAVHPPLTAKQLHRWGCSSFERYQSETVFCVTPCICYRLWIRQINMRTGPV